MLKLISKPLKSFNLKFLWKTWTVFWTWWQTSVIIIRQPPAGRIAAGGPRHSDTELVEEAVFGSLRFGWDLFYFEKTTWKWIQNRPGQSRTAAGSGRRRDVTWASSRRRAAERLLFFCSFYSLCHQEVWCLTYFPSSCFKNQIWH